MIESENAVIRRESDPQRLALSINLTACRDLIWAVIHYVREKPGNIDLWRPRDGLDQQLQWLTQARRIRRRNVGPQTDERVAPHAETLRLRYIKVGYVERGELACTRVVQARARFLLHRINRC